MMGSCSWASESEAKGAQRLVAIPSRALHLRRKLRFGDAEEEDIAADPVNDDLADITLGTIRPEADVLQQLLAGRRVKIW